MRIDHLGIATDDAAGLSTLYSDLFGCEIAHEETLDDLEIVFLDVGNTYLELLESRDEDSEIGRYVAQDGPSIHHVAMETDDIEAALETARDLGLSLIDEEPRSGAWGHDIAFLHPSSTGGILVEFVEH